MTTPQLTKPNDRSKRLQVGGLVELTRLMARQAARQQFQNSQSDKFER